MDGDSPGGELGFEWGDSVSFFAESRFCFLLPYPIVRVGTSPAIILFFSFFQCFLFFFDDSSPFCLVMGGMIGISYAREEI